VPARECKYLPVCALAPNGPNVCLVSHPGTAGKQLFPLVLAPITQIRAGVFQNGANDRAQAEIVIRMSRV
jgi:hypothetical protein